MTETNANAYPAVQACGVSMAEVAAEAAGLQSFIAQATIRAAAMQMEMFGQMLRGEYTGDFPEVPRG